MIGGFAARYPVVWHVIEAEGADCRTLYPAAMLRRLAGLPPDDANRDDFQCLPAPEGNPAVLRMQLMRDEALRPTLAGAFFGQPGLWRAHLNQHVFFWASEDRRDRFITACMRLRARGVLGPGGEPVVMAIDTEALLAAHRSDAFFSVINTGSTVRAGARVRRDETTLRRVAEWRGERPVELAIRGPVALAAVRSRQSAGFSDSSSELAAK
jgi:hypothetical protein